LIFTYRTGGLCLNSRFRFSIARAESTNAPLIHLSIYIYIFTSIVLHDYFVHYPRFFIGLAFCVRTQDFDSRSRGGNLQTRVASGFHTAVPRTGGGLGRRVRLDGGDYMYIYICIYTYIYICMYVFMYSCASAGGGLG